MKQRLFRLALILGTLAGLVAALGAPQKWG
jgi:hypothetical protein